MNEEETDKKLSEVDEALVAKDLKTALKICKEILQADQNNYKALIKIGLVLLKRDLDEQALKAFRKATQVAPNNVEAWYHLLGFYLLDGAATKKADDLIPLYIGLAKAETDVFSWKDHIDKVLSLCDQKGNIGHVVPLLLDVSTNGVGMKQDFAVKALQKIGQMKWPDDQLHHLMYVYAVLAQKKEAKNFQLKYLKCLFKLKYYVQFFNEAQNLHKIHQSEVFPLKQICKGFYKLSVLNEIIPQSIDDNINALADELVSIDSKQEHDALIAKGVDLFKKCNFFDARFAFNKAVKTGKPESWWGWLHLARSHLSLLCYKGALYCCFAALSYMEKSKSPFELKVEVKLCLEKILCEAACNCSAELDITEGKKMCLKKLIAEPYNPFLLQNYCIANLTLNELDIFTEYYDRLKKTEAVEHSFLRYLEGFYLKQSHKLEEAASTLKSIINATLTDHVLLSKVYVLLANVSLELKNLNDAHQFYLMAAKFSPNWYLPYYLLGCYYMNVLKNWDKARRCFHKAYEYNPFFTEAGKGLSDAYNKLDLPQQNIEILLKVASNSGEKWAWIRLGRLYSMTNQHQQASDCYLKVLKTNDEDSQCWELLAVSYSARGMYHAAIKSFERATEINPNLLYSKYRAATIKLLIGRFDEALDEFRVLVREDPNSVPYLKGLAETCFKLAQVLFKKHILITCKDRCQEAMDNLCRAQEATEKKLCCLWKLMGDVCCLVSKLPSALVHLRMSSNFPESCETSSQPDDKPIAVLERDSILDLASRSYWEAVRICEREESLSPALSPLLYDVTYSYHLHASLSTDETKRFQLREEAFKVALKCIALDDQNVDYWNILGTIAVSQELRMYDIAQHAFITITELNGNCADGWSNLGVLYLMHGNYSLAHRMFQSAQDSDPNHVSSWIGQAMIAEIIQVYDAMDLFRHAVVMEYHPESSLGFADFVCFNLCSSNSKSIEEYMSSVPLAIDALNHYIMRNESDINALNLLGILLGKFNLLKSSVQVLKRALILAGDNKEITNVIKRNLCSSLIDANLFSNAISLYQSITDKDSNVKLGLAQAYIKDKQFEKAFSMYRSIYGVLKQKDDMRGHLLFAMSSAAYQSENVDDSEALLYECLKFPAFVPRVLIALGALSLLEDENLNSVHLVLRDLVPYRFYPEHCSKIALLNACVSVAQGNLGLAKSEICKLIVRWPNHIEFWIELSLTLLYCHHPPLNPVEPSALNACVKSYSQKGFSNAKQSLILTCLTQLSMKYYEDALHTAQRSVLRYPNSSDGWILTLSAFYLKSKSTMLSSLISYISQCECSDQQKLWLHQFSSHFQSKQ